MPLAFRLDVPQEEYAAWLEKQRTTNVERAKRGMPSLWRWTSEENPLADFLQSQLPSEWHDHESRVDLDFTDDDDHESGKRPIIKLFGFEAADGCRTILPVELPIWMHPLARKYGEPRYKSERRYSIDGGKYAGTYHEPERITQEMAEADLAELSSS